MNKQTNKAFPWAGDPGMLKKVTHKLKQKRKTHSSMLYVLIREAEKI